MTTSTDKFYSDLPLQDLTINQVLKNQALFSQVPQDWHVVVTDVKNSTGAINAGQHQIVNLVATGSIIAGLNIARKYGLSLPFFFGGDGATLLVPPSLIGPIITALREHCQNTKSNFNLELRVGQLQVAEILNRQQQLLISKARITEDFNIPVILGNGLQYVENVLKQAMSPQYYAEETALLDLSGMECRWDQIAPPDYRQEVLCLLVVTLNKEAPGDTFAKVLDRIDEIYGQLSERNPISVSKLKLKSGLTQLGTESKVRHGSLQRGYQIKNWIQTLIGHYYLNYHKEGKYYTKKLVELSDTLVLDGKINTVISGTGDQRKNLISGLKKMEGDKEILFGWHVSSGSIMSCYVRDRLDQHIHFIDGTDGGYTKAAGMLKKKLSHKDPKGGQLG